MAYLEEPSWTIGSKGEAALIAHFPITNINGFLSQKHNVAFVVSCYYTQGGRESEVQAALRSEQPFPHPKPSEFPGFNIRALISAPYLFWYYYRSSDAFSGLSTHHEGLTQLLTSWIGDNYGAKYNFVDEQLERGVISHDSMPFLVRPGDVLIWESKHELHTSITKSWPKQDANSIVAQAADMMKEMDWDNNRSTAIQLLTTWSVDSWKYVYDGQFLRKQQVVKIVLEHELPHDEFRIQRLNTYPLRFADRRLSVTLENRGKTSWRCRQQILVSYNDERELGGIGERYMVDFQTCERVEFAEMESDNPPAKPKIYVFPSTIPGYNMRSKKWLDMKVDYSKMLPGIKKSFEQLVVDSKTKDLVQALVMHQISGGQSTDIIERKGNGLIILLHGGPGMGKTLTAESVVELAEKPLFHVTCGDIGTEPEKVENYLESVLHLGKTWGCVVLVDEAEVFLEQRSLDNLERNALVPVFLRVLEYYEGILILTSNRVGPFDEAFKSRILLSLHYDNLTLGQRTRIWKIFISRLKHMDLDGARSAACSAPTALPPVGGLSGSRKRKFEEPETGIDFSDIECSLGELAAFELNGRQIRNVITAATQYASFKKVLMNHEHLKHVITVSSKFEKYLKTVQEGYSGDEIMRSEGVR
ncbi:AAA family ATPase [Xylariaceae sp. FL1651]|nr:AAA family ATPase [Xylariaceae sp. FL1651]